jgi:hypothetical protein
MNDPRIVGSEPQTNYQKIQQILAQIMEVESLLFPNSVSPDESAESLTALQHQSKCMDKAILKLGAIIEELKLL